MHHFPYPSYLRTHRDRYALTQDELAALLGVGTRTVISKYETLAREPSARALIAAEFIFGEPARRIFPGLYAAVELAVAASAALFAESLIGNDTPKGRAKRELLEEIANRAASDQLTI